LWGRYSPHAFKEGKVWSVSDDLSVEFEIIKALLRKRTPEEAAACEAWLGIVEAQLETAPPTFWFWLFATRKGIKDKKKLVRRAAATGSLPLVLRTAKGLNIDRDIIRASHALLLT